MLVTLTDHNWDIIPGSKVFFFFSWKNNTVQLSSKPTSMRHAWIELSLSIESNCAWDHKQEKIRPPVQWRGATATCINLASGVNTPFDSWCVNSHSGGHHHWNADTPEGWATLCQWSSVVEILWDSSPSPQKHPWNCVCMWSPAILLLCTEYWGCVFCVAWTILAVYRAVSCIVLYWVCTYTGHSMGRWLW